MKLLLLVLFGVLAQEKLPDAVKKAQAKLEKDADDPDANLTVGKYFAFDQDDWARGLPFIAKGSDKLLAPVVERDLAAPKDGKGMIALGDEWLALSAKRQPKKPIQDRALYWFKEAWFLVDSMEKAKLRSLFLKIAAPPVGYEKPKKGEPQPTGWAIADITGGFVETGFARTGAKSIKTLSAVKAPGAGYAFADTSMFPITPGRKAVITAWVYSDKTDSDGKLDVRVFDRNAVPPALVVKSFPIPQDCPFWQKIVGEVEIPQGGVRIMIHFANKATMGALWIDDVSIIVDGKDVAKNGGVDDKK
jgi:hypothetical protein